VGQWCPAMYQEFLRKINYPRNVIPKIKQDLFLYIEMAQWVLGKIDGIIISTIMANFEIYPSIAIISITVRLFYLVLVTYVD
jgi:hypothetical protein